MGGREAEAFAARRIIASNAAAMMRRIIAELLILLSHFSSVFCGGFIIV
jgi:hypothetical protein